MTDIYQRIVELERAGRSFVVATVVRAVSPTSARPGDRAIVRSDGAVEGWVGGSCAEPTVRREAAAALADGESRLVQITPEPEARSEREGLVLVPMTCFSGGELEILVEPHVTARELVIFGRSPIALALERLGAASDLRVRRFDEPPGDGEPRFAEPSTGAAVVATHGVFDEEALASVLRADLGYVGLVCSHRRAESVRRDLAGRGFSAEEIARIDGPAGLDLGARRPGDVAVSILAGIVAATSTAEAGGESADRAGAEESCCSSGGEEPATEAAEESAPAGCCGGGEPRAVEGAG